VLEKWKHTKKGKGLQFDRDLNPKERAKQIVKDKTNSSQLTDAEVRELVFLAAKEGE
jgi:hypothetical protein